MELRDLVRGFLKKIKPRISDVDALKPSIDAILNVLKEDRNINIDEKLADLEENFNENKIKLVYAESQDDVMNYLSQLMKKERLSIMIDDFSEFYEMKLYKFLIDNKIPHVYLDPTLEYAKRKYDIVSPENIFKAMIDIRLSDFTKGFLKKIKDIAYKSYMGISGAIAIAANMGSIFLLDMNGLSGLAATTPHKHIVVTGLDKVFYDFFSAFKVAVNMRRIIDKEGGSNLYVISNPSRTGDIEKIVIYGAHGPRELTVILLDNGRRGLFSENIWREVSICNFCGLCGQMYPYLEVLSKYLNLSTYLFPQLIILINGAYAGDLETLSRIAAFLEIFKRDFKCPFDAVRQTIIYDILKKLYALGVSREKAEEIAEESRILIEG